MEEENARIRESMIVAVFCLSASLGAGFSIKQIVAYLTGWQALAYAFGVGIFIAISAVCLHLFLSSLREK